MTRLPNYLTKDRNGTFYFRWPLPQEPGTTRKTLRLSLSTKCPDTAARLSRQLAAGADVLLSGGMADQTDIASLGFVEAKKLFTNHFKAKLREAKAKLDHSGPLPPENRANILACDMPARL